jgi:hypothetical protein
MAKRSTLLCCLVAATPSLGVAAAGCGSKSGAGAPQDNPAATLYGASAYPWTAGVRWQCAYVVTDFAGASDDARFEAAQAAAVADGGGVVFFPAGSYSFAANLSLASNVVVRGAPVPPSARAKSGKLPGNLSPTTVFNCPNRAHQGLWNFDAAATNLGVVNVLLDQCAVMLWPSLKTSSFSPMLSNWWFSASDINGMGSNKIVLGNVVRDVSLGQSLLGPKYKNIYPYIFSIAVGVYTDRNALVANNLLPPSTRSETTKITLASGSETVPYMYDNRYGIDVNSILLGAVAGAYCKGAGSKCGTPSAFGGLFPACAPWNFRSGIAIRDNYVAQNGRVGISFTGGADDKLCTPGSGTQLLNNHVEVRAGTTCYTISGDDDPRGSDTNENRAYSEYEAYSTLPHVKPSYPCHQSSSGNAACPPTVNSGYCSNMTGNTGHSNRQMAGKSGYETVDGEGILHQSENGNSAFGDVYANNDLSGGGSGYIGVWDLPFTNYTVFTNNKVNSDQQIGVISIQGSDTVGPGVLCSGNSPPAIIGKAPCPSKA